MSESLWRAWGIGPRGAGLVLAVAACAALASCGPGASSASDAGNANPQPLPEPATQHNNGNREEPGATLGEATPAPTPTPANPNGVPTLAQPAGVPADPARTGGQPTGPTPVLVPTAPGTHVTTGQMPAGGNLPVGLYTCARCHMVPSPDVLPRARWAGALRRMNELIVDFELGEALTEGQLAEVIAYYESRAPVGMAVLPVEAGPADRTSPVVWQSLNFGRREAIEPGARVGPVIAGVRITDLDRNGSADVLLSDAKNNALGWVYRGASGTVEDRIPGLTVPSRTEVVDIEGDGDLDIVVACLGSLEPTDNLVGSIVLLVNDGLGNLNAQELLAGEPRACDVRAADMDGDGDLDLVFATFGLFHTGRAGWLEQVGPREFVAHDLLRANGISHVPVGDVNGDGRPDVVVLLSQQHEKVMLFLNLGREEGVGADGKPHPVRFREIELWRAPHPMWGHSSAELVDLDQDGDLDVLVTNGDALDSEPYPKPWHGVQWLENRSEGERIEFVYRRIGGFHGAYWAGVGDFDLDGDLDVIATSMMNQWQDERRAGTVWFENDGAMNFTLWPVPGGPAYQVVGDVGDMDGDGRPDVVTGGMFVFPPHFRPARAWLWLSRPAPVQAPLGPVSP